MLMILLFIQTTLKLIRKKLFQISKLILLIQITGIGHEICINISKSKSMAFGTRHQVKHCDPPNVTLGNIGLEIVPHYKYLGIFGDTHLTFTK